MRDGVRIAIDVTLPKNHKGALPTILRQTRYHRRMKLRPPFDRPPLRQLFDQQYEARRYFVTRGYAWVDVCVRGSGASDGERPAPWAAGERADSAEVLDWIVRQEWSNGAVGARGVSYDGTAAEFVLWHHHPALRAVAPRFSLFDIYDDIAMPGGIHLEQFTANWARFNDALDRNRFDDVLGLILGLSSEGRQQLGRGSYGSRLDVLAGKAMRFDTVIKASMRGFVGGVAAVDGDPSGELVAEHVARRAPALDVFDVASRMTFRDDGDLSDRYPDLRIDHFSPAALLPNLRSDVPVFHYTGWFDGAYQRAAVKRFHASDAPNHRLIIGPWEHGGRQNISPWEPSRVALFDHEAELLRFFDAYVGGPDGAQEQWEATPRVRYFTLGAERWSTSETWPPAAAVQRRFHFAESGRLCPQREISGGEDHLEVAGHHGTGEASRWRCLLPLLTLTHYGPRVGSDVVAYTSSPLGKDAEVTGHPVVHVHLCSSAADLRLFAYLEDVAADGSAHYVTEGQLRGIHRRLKVSKPASHRAIPYRTYRRADRRSAEAGEWMTLEFDLLPTSYLFRRGHRIRLVLAGADSDHFEVGPLGRHTIRRSKSWLDLPILS